MKWQKRLLVGLVVAVGALLLLAGGGLGLLVCVVRASARNEAREAFSEVCHCPTAQVAAEDTDREEHYRIRGCGMDVVWRCHDDVPCTAGKSAEDCGRPGGP